MFWPFTVWGFLKPNFEPHEYWLSRTRCCNSTYRLRYWNSSCSKLLSISHLKVATVLTVYGIETIIIFWLIHSISSVATVLTVYGIETIYLLINITISYHLSCNSTYRLRYWNSNTIESPYALSLQQYLPFTVLKLPYGLIL